MSFGKTLKRIRLKHKDSLRGLAKKIDLHFTFIDKVEKGTAPISKNFIENVIAVYPDEREILKKEYLKETLPNVFQKMCIRDSLIVNISKILNISYFIASIFQISSNCIKENSRSCVSYMNIVIHCWSTNIH